MRKDYKYSHNTFAPLEKATEKKGPIFRAHPVRESSLGGLTQLFLVKRYCEAERTGFTLIEVIISVAIISIVTLVISAFFLNNQSVINTAIRRQEVYNEGHIATKYITRSIKNSDEVDLINPSDGISSEIELTQLDTGGGVVEKLRYQLSDSNLRFYSDYLNHPNDYRVIAKGISSLSFSDGEGEGKTEGLKLIDIDLTVQDSEGKISTNLSTQATCRDRIFIIEYDWFNGTHNWQYNATDGTLTCVDEGYDWAITLEETGVLSPEVMDYMGYSDEDIINFTFEDGVMTDVDGRQVVDGVVIIMSQDQIAIVPPETTDIELHQSYSNYNFEVTVAAKIGGYAPTISFGYYTYDAEGEKVLVEIVPASGEEPPITSDLFIPPVGEDFGFYMDIGASGYTYYTETSENPDSYDHAWEYVSDELGTLVIGWEDLYGGGDEDHQDFVVTIKPVGIVD